jgi:hypothetical protein
MKRISKAQSEKLKPVYLYKDDVSDLFEIFERGCKTVELEAAGYGLESMSEFEKLSNESINELHIQGREPYVSLHFRPNGIFLYINEDTHHQIGVFEEIKSFVNSKRRRLSWLTQSPLAPGILGGIAFQFIPMDKNEITTYSILLVISMFALAIFWFWWSFHSSFKKYSIIQTQRSRKDGNFFQRKKDDILLAFISASVGVAITLLVTKVFG